MHTLTQERLLWPMIRAICEIGGAMGLYLGFSVLSVLQAASAAITVCFIAIKSTTFRIFGWSHCNHNTINHKKSGRKHIGTGTVLNSPTKVHSDFSAKLNMVYVPDQKIPLTGYDTEEEGMIGPVRPVHGVGIDSEAKMDSDTGIRKYIVNTLKWMQPRSMSHQLVHFTSQHDNSSSWCKKHIWLVAAILPCAIIFCPMAINQYLDYASFPVFTSYEANYLDKIIFPGVTFCIWPPFNPLKLKAFGVSYNYSQHCYRLYDVNNWKVKCEWEAVYADLLQKLPGLWTQDLDQLWEEAAWKPSDIFSSYMFAGKTYKPNGDAGSPLTPTLSVLNRCFTFISPQKLVHPHSVLDMKRTKLSQEYSGLERCTDAKYFWNLKNMFSANSIHDFWKCYGDYFEINIFVHPPGHPPLLLDDAAYTELKLMASKVRSRIDVSLEIYNRLQTPSLPCVDSKDVEGESQEICVQRCIAEALVNQMGCRLPYVNWLPTRLCTRNEYIRYPKYKASVKEALSNQSGITAACLATCPETCTVLHYSTIETPEAGDNIKVAFRRPMYTEIRESWSFSTIQLVSNVGSLASLFLGVSLYQLLTCCLKSDD